MDIDDVDNYDCESIGDEEVEATRTTAPLPDELKPCEKKALLELRSMIEESIASGQLLKPTSPTVTSHHHHHHHHHRHPRREKSRSRVSSSSSFDSFSLDDFVEEPREPEGCVAGDEDLINITLWGIPLSSSKNHEGTDVILIKFLQARDFKSAEAFDMLRRTLRWRRQFKVEDAAFAPTGEAVAHLKKAVYMDGRDREGNPVFYNMYGVFKDKEDYRRTFGSQEQREQFLWWRVALMEEGVKMMSMKPGGAAAMLNIIDLKDLLRPGMKELRSATRDTISILQDNYPEFVAKNRTRSKFIFARPAKVTETLLKFIAPENIPVQYGGLKREEDEEFDEENGTSSEIHIRAGSMSSIEIPTPETGMTVVWDIMVVEGEVSYREEFIPEDEGSYKILIRKDRKLEECSRNSFYISEPGKLLVTFDNKTYKRKRLFYRSKTKPTVPVYNVSDHSNPPSPSPKLI